MDITVIFIEIYCNIDVIQCIDYFIFYLTFYDLCNFTIQKQSNEAEWMNIIYYVH